MTTFKDLQHGTVNPFQPNTKAISYSLDKTLEQGVHRIDLITSGTYTLGLWLDDTYVGMFCGNSLTFELANDVYVENVIIKEYNELGEIEYVKLVSGSNVTEWTPAPEDGYGYTGSDGAYHIQGEQGFTSPNIPSTISSVVVHNWAETTLNGSQLELNETTFFNGNDVIDFAGNNLDFIASDPSITHALTEFASQSYESSQPVSPITKVTAYYDDESAFTAGVDGSSELKIDNRWATQSSTNYVLSQIDGYEYLPAKGFNVYLDPAYELGDYFEYEDGTEQLIANLTWTFGGITTANVESPISSENNFDDPRQNLINQQFKRKVSLGQNYQGVSIGRDDGIQMLLSPDGKEEEAIARWYSDLTKGQAFQTRATPNDEWVDWMYFDINEKIYKLSLYSTTDDVDAKIQFSIEQVHMGNLILNFNGQDEYSGVTGYSNLLTSDELTSSDFLTNMMPAMPIEILGSKSRYGWRFNNSGYLEWDRVYKSESGIHSFKGRFDGDMDVEVKITEYENYDDVTALKETVKTLTSEEYREFSIELDDDTNFFNLAMNVPSASPTNYLYASELMFTYGDPKDYYEGAADAFAYARATRTMLGSRITDAVTEIDRLTGDIHNTTVDITARDGVEIRNNNGKGLTVYDDNNEKSIELNGDGRLITREMHAENATITGNLNAGKISNMDFDATGITFPNGKLKLDSANNSINFGNIEMSFGDNTNDGQGVLIKDKTGYWEDGIFLHTNGGVRVKSISPTVSLNGTLQDLNITGVNFLDTYRLNVNNRIQVISNGSVDIGESARRIRNIYLTSQPNVSSDTRHKFAIQDIPQGLLDEISKVDAKMYLQGDKWNFGYMAQDIERALYLWATRKYGLDAKYYVDKFSILHKSGSYLSLLYGEISVMKIKSLEARLEKLENERK